MILLRSKCYKKHIHMDSLIHKQFGNRTFVIISDTDIAHLQVIKKAIRQSHHGNHTRTNAAMSTELKRLVQRQRLLSMH